MTGTASEASSQLRRMNRVIETDSRERTFLALAHQTGDRIPVDFWASAAMIRKLETRLGISYEQFLDRHDVDFRYIAGPRYIGPPLTEGQDIIGVRRTVVHVATKDGTEVYSEVAESPLATCTSVADIRSYPHWPSPDWFDYSGIAAQCDAVHTKGRVAVFMGDRLNRIAQLKPAMYLRGVEAILADMAMNEDLADALFARIREFYLGYLSRILAAAQGKIDIVLTGDDFGSQTGMLVSPGMWRRFLRPGFADYLGLIRSHETLAMHHTCGSVTEIIPDFIDCGLDILQSLQPEAAHMSLDDLQQRFGDQLSFQGGISIQRTMPFGTPGEIRAAVARIAALVGNRGGYIFCTAHNIQADTPVENVMALLEAYRDYGSCSPATTS